MTFDDWAFTIELYNQEDFLKNIGDKQVRTKEEALRHIEEGPMKMHKDCGVSLMIVELNDGKKVGTCGLLKRDILPHPDLGYALLPSYYRQGIIEEAARAVLAHYKELPEVLAITNPDNQASQQLLTKLGFQEIEPFNGYSKAETTTFKYIR